MKKLMMLAIPALLLICTIVKIAYSWSAYAGAGYYRGGSTPHTYADAYASNYGLSDGQWWVTTKIGTRQKVDGGRFAGAGILTLHDREPNANVWAFASSSVDGWRTIVKPNGEEVEVFEWANDQDTHHP